ncbi:MAG: methyl-accepting chemotaxis protein [Campylobacterales bacterium]|nr:methyl-accepting chemotaxis protein [Campylobacterales bacterium]
MDITIKTKLNITFGAIIVIVLVAGFFIYSSLTHLTHVIHVEEEKFEEMLLAKDLRDIHTHIVLETVESITGKNMGVNSNRQEKIKKEFKKFYKIEKKFIHSLETAEEKSIGQRIVKQLKDLEPIVTTELSSLLQSDGSNSDFLKLHKKIDLVAGNVENDVNNIVKILHDEVEEAKKDVNSTQKMIVLEMELTGFILLVLILTSSYFLTKNINGRIGNLIDLIRESAENKDLTVNFHTSKTDEVSQVKMAVTTLFNSFTEILKSAKRSSDENSSVSQELSATSQQIGERVEQQSDSLEKSTHSLETIVEKVNHSVDNAKETMDNVKITQEHLESAKNDINQLTGHVEETSEREAELSEKLEAVSSSAKDVKEVLTVISDIAEQTNLLALNAAIEAARAGEHGRGFAVVADEVRKLAERTQKSLGEINITINQIVQAIIDANNDMKENSHKIHVLLDLSSSVESKITETTENMNDVYSSSTSTEEGAVEIKKLTEHIKSEFDEINSVSISNARSVEEIAEASKHLSKLTVTLTTKLEEIRIA